MVYKCYKVYCLKFYIFNQKFMLSVKDFQLYNLFQIIAPVSKRTIIRNIINQTYSQSTLWTLLFIINSKTQNQQLYRTTCESNNTEKRFLLSLKEKLIRNINYMNDFSRKCNSCNSFSFAICNYLVSFIFFYMDTYIGSYGILWKIYFSICFE